MYSRVKYLKIYLPAIFAGLLLLSACENDLNKVRAIAAADATKPLQKTIDVHVIYSDSAVVKAELTAPLLLQYQTKNPYSEMPNGVKVVFYNAGLVRAGDIIADSAVNYESKNLIVFRKNVVATNTEGTTYKSDELIWDQKTKQIYSNKAVLMTKVGGDETRGTSFKSDDKLLNPIFQNATAIIHVDNSTVQ